jgi:hypothetical protein
MVATLLMTFVLYGGPLLTVPEFDVASMYGSLSAEGAAPADLSNPWFFGLLVHIVFMVVLLPVLYGYALYSMLSGRPWARGLIFGGILLLAMMFVLLPLFGRGVFFLNTPAPIVLTCLATLALAVYGLALGIAAGAQVEEPVHVSREMEVNG